MSVCAALNANGTSIFLHANENPHVIFNSIVTTSSASRTKLIKIQPGGYYIILIYISININCKKVGFLVDNWPTITTEQLGIAGDKHLLSKFKVDYQHHQIWVPTSTCKSFGETSSQM